MAFLYRYLDQHGQVKYVGLVKGDSSSDLARRFGEHLPETGFKSWTCEVISGLSRAEADALETHFINKTADTNINIAKKGMGTIRFLDLRRLPRWQPYTPPEKDETNKGEKAHITVPQTADGICIGGLSFFHTPADLSSYPMFLNIKKTCEATGISQYYLRKRAKEGSIPVLVVGREGHGTYMINIRAMCSQFEREMAETVEVKT